MIYKPVLHTLKGNESHGKGMERERGDKVCTDVQNHRNGIFPSKR
jgi:hypothetical protein